MKPEPERNPYFNTIKKTKFAIHISYRYKKSAYVA